MSQISALKRITPKEQQINNKFNQIILNKDVIQISIGRDIDCNYRISSIEISRKHALIEYCISENYWNISDLNSTNGLFVNSQQLQSYSPHRLINGDKVSFGPPNQSQFNYQFIDNYTQNNSNCVSYELSAINLTTIPVIPIVTRIQNSSNSAEGQIVSANTLRLDIEPNQSRSISLTANMPTRSGVNYQIISRSSSSQQKKVLHKTSDRSVVTNFVEHDYSRSTASMTPDSETRAKDRSGRRVSLLKLKKRSNSDSKVSEIERKRIAREMEKIEKWKRNLEIKKESERIRIKRKEEALKAKKKELDKKERETKKREEEIEKLRKELNREKKKWSERQQNSNAGEEESHKSSKRKRKSSSVDTKRQCIEADNESDISVIEKRKQLEEIFESEMTCSVCHEYFIHAVNLNCSHTFCYACIEEWKSKNGQHVCPICRNKIENQNRELILDNLIDRFVGKMKPQLREHREGLIEERKKKLEKKTIQTASNRSNGNRGNRLSNIFPSLHFFLRETNDSADSDPDSDDVNVIGFGYADNFVDSSSDSSDLSSSDSSDSSEESNSSSGDSSSDDESAESHVSYPQTPDYSHHSSDSEDVEDINDTSGFVLSHTLHNSSDSDVESPDSDYIDINDNSDSENSNDSDISTDD